MTQTHHRVEYEIAYCAWAVLAPALVARLPVPALSPWFMVFLEAVRTAAPQPDDSSGQQLRRAIIAGATPEQPFPGEIRGKALLVEGAVHRLTVPRLSELGTPGAIVRALGVAADRPASRSA